MTLCNFFSYILEYLETIQNSLPAHNREHQEVVRQASRSWWRCWKAQNLIKLIKV